MFIASPVVGIGEPESRPELTTTEEQGELLQEGGFPSEQGNEPLGVVGNCEAVVPSVSLHIVVGEGVDSFVGRELEKGAIGVLGFEKVGVVVPQVFVEGRPVHEILVNKCLIGEEGDLTDAEIVGTEFEGLADRRTSCVFETDEASFFVLEWVGAGVMRSLFIGIPEHVGQGGVDSFRGEICLDCPVSEDGVGVGSNHAASPALGKGPFGHIPSFLVHQQQRISHVIET